MEVEGVDELWGSWTGVGAESAFPLGEGTFTLDIANVCHMVAWLVVKVVILTHFDCGVVMNSCILGEDLSRCAG